MSAINEATPRPWVCPSRAIRNSSRSAAPADLHVAKRLRIARIQAGMSQEAAGAIAGVAFQQITKYESGENRVTIGRLVALANAYRKPVAWFFEGLGESVEEVAGINAPLEMVSLPYGLDLARDYIALRSNQDRSVVASVARALRGRS